MNKSLKFLLIILFISVPGSLAAVELKICTDNNYWYPYTYMEHEKSLGMHVDMVRQALKNTGHKAIFTPLPWKRCLKEMEKGQYNAVVSASYKPDRAEYLIYPPDAQVGKESKWRIMQVSYAVVTHINNKYQFTGDLNTLPEPVRAPFAYSIAEDMRSAGINVKTDYNIIECVKKLLRSQNGVVIMPPRNAEILNNKGIGNYKLNIHKIPIKSKSYFIAFSKVNPLFSQEEIRKIWNEILRLREDNVYMQKLFDKY